MVAIGDATVQVERQDAGELLLTLSFGEDTRRLRVAASTVTHWCADAALLLGASLTVGGRDEAELRTPMLVALDEQCIAMSRRITASSSVVALIVSRSPEQIEGEGTRGSAPDSPSAAHALIAALRDAAR